MRLDESAGCVFAFAIVFVFSCCPWNGIPALGGLGLAGISFRRIFSDMKILRHHLPVEQVDNPMCEACIVG